MPAEFFFIIELIPFDASQFKGLKENSTFRKFFGCFFSAVSKMKFFCHVSWTSVDAPLSFQVHCFELLLLLELSPTFFKQSRLYSASRHVQSVALTRSVLFPFSFTFLESCSFIIWTIFHVPLYVSADFGNRQLLDYKSNKNLD